VAVVRSLLDATVRETGQLKDILDAPVLGHVERDDGLSAVPNFGRAEYSSASEQFRRIRTNLMFVDVDRAQHAFLVTSSVAGEGKTTVSSHLAASFAASGHKTLLLDADLRRPRIADVFGLSSDVGLTSILLGKLSSAEAAQSIGKNLDVITSGTLPPNPSELLASRAMAVFLKAVRERYDIVVIDAPPLLPVADAAILTSIVDTTVLVVRAGSTNTRTIQSGAEAIASTGDNLGGVILTLTSPSGVASSYYGSYEPRRQEPAAVDDATTAIHSVSDKQRVPAHQQGPIPSPHPRRR
jgi:receptor protein-tyrosine kinase